MKKYIDEIFGEVKYNTGWTCEKIVKLFEQENLVLFIIDSNEENKIEKKYHENYKKYLFKEEKISKILLEKIKEYIKNYPGNENKNLNLNNYLDILKFIKPLSYLFIENDIIMEFDFKLDQELGLAIKINIDNIEEVEVDVPDKFI